MNARVKLSSKGQIVLPKAVRDAHGWSEGTEFELVDDDAGGVRLLPVHRDEPDIPRLTIEEFLAGRIKYDGPPVTLEDMDRAVLKEAARRWHAKNS